MRHPEDYEKRVKKRSEETGKIRDYTAAKAFWTYTQNTTIKS
jgi:hypothetical protein